MAKTVSQHSTLEEWRQSYNELASDVGDIGGLRTQDKTTLVDAVNDLRDREFFFQGFIYTATGGQTVFEGADSSSDANVLEFRDHRFLVFKNGDLQQLSTDFTISNVNANGNHTRVTLTSGATAGDVIRVVAFTGSFLDVAGQAAVQTFWTETLENTIYNNNDSGVIINGDIGSVVTTLQSGYVVQIEGKTFINGDVDLDTGHQLSAPTLTDNTLSINQGNVTGGVTGDFSGDFNVGNLDVGGGFGSTGVSITATGNINANGNVDIDGTLNVDSATTLNDALTTTGLSSLDGGIAVSDGSTGDSFTVAATTGNTQIDGTLEVDGTAGIDGDCRVGSAGADKFNVTASNGNTQIDGTLEVDGTAGIDGNFRVGSDKFNVTAASGNTQIDGTLGVDGQTNLNGHVNLGSDGDDTVSFLGDLDSDIIPDADSSRDLGSSDFKFANAYIDTTTGNLVGNASTATTLETARTIGGVSFDGSANINLPGVNQEGNQDTTGNAASATVLETERTIAGVGFDGSANIELDTSHIDENGRLYFTDARADARVQAAIDTDNTFGSASDTLVPSQLAVKTYVDGQLDLQDELSEMSGDSGDITEGSNLYFTTARADARIAAASVGDLSDVDITGVTAGQALTWDGNNNRFAPTTLGSSTDSFTEGSNNLYFTNERARDAVANLIVNSNSSHTGISTTYNDGTSSEEGTLVFTVDSEYIRDTAATLITSGTHSGISFTHDDGNDKLNASVSLSGFSTTNLSEGSNLYFTNARADARIAAADTGDLSEDPSATTSSGTMYFTNERAQDAAAAMITSATHSNISVSYDDATNKLSFSAAAQYNDSLARQALSGGPGIDYNSSTGKISADLNASGGLEFHAAGDVGEIRLKASVAGSGLAHSNGVLNINTRKGVKIDSDFVESDYEVVGTAPTGVGSTNDGHLWYVV